MKRRRKTVRLGTDPVSTPCPFCAGTFIMPDIDDLEAGRADSTLVHTMPPCRKFIDLDPPEFLSQARVALEGN